VTAVWADKLSRGGGSMSDMKVELRESLTRQQAADKLSALASALAKGGDVELELGGVMVNLHVADDVRSELEVEIDGNELELELELKWLTTGAERAAAAAGEPEQERPQPRAIPSL
jgi:amphi-Trp domain-containing protein